MDITLHNQLINIHYDANVYMTQVATHVYSVTYIDHESLISKLVVVYGKGKPMTKSMIECSKVIIDKYYNWVCRPFSIKVKVKVEGFSLLPCTC